MTPDTPLDLGRPSPSSPSPSDDQLSSVTFKLSVFFAFFWCIFGLAIIYGIRIYWNSPIHPSFVPFMGAGFSVIVAFAIVLTLKNVTGDPIEVKLFGNELKGASGPIILWVICFLSIVYGLYLLGIAEVFRPEIYRIESLRPSPLHRIGESRGTGLP